MSTDYQINTTQIDLTYAQIESAIRCHETWGGSPKSPVVGDMTDVYCGYDGVDFEAEVMNVWQALSAGPLSLTHEVEVNFTWESDGTTSGAQMEVVLPRVGYVSARFMELKHLTSDRGETGVDGLVAIADALIHAANESLILARRLVEAQHEEADANGVRR